MEVVIKGYMCTFLLLHACYGNLPGLGVVREVSLSSEGSYLEEAPTISRMSHYAKYRCYQCEGSQCEEETISCVGAAACFSSSRRRADGPLERARGCVPRLDQSPCRSLHYRRHRRPVAAMNVTCCMGNMCNGGEFPALPAAATTDNITTTTGAPPASNGANVSVLISDKENGNLPGHGAAPDASPSPATIHGPTTRELESASSIDGVISTTARWFKTGGSRQLRKSSERPVEVNVTSCVGETCHGGEIPAFSAEATTDNINSTPVATAAGTPLASNGNNSVLVSDVEKN